MTAEICSNHEMEKVISQMDRNTIKQQERKEEEQHLASCIKIIESNIEKFSIELAYMKAETKQLYDNYRASNPELHNDLVIKLNMQSQIERTLIKNEKAVERPYFGRIDYVEHGEELPYSLYLGKNGVMHRTTEIVVVDWRAPISSVYYDSDVGESSYLSPTGEKILIRLNLKRTFEILNRKLIDYYDTDVITNDEFLTKYLAKSKEVILGEIIATIQKEQNEIIRDTPWHSVIVQGVAGSGKTTVAMHRISYLLYNYKEKFRSDEFYIIGSNKMLLNYITGVLPNLDVYNINQMTLSEFFLRLLDKDLNMKKLKLTYIDSFRSKAVKSDDLNRKGEKQDHHYLEVTQSQLKKWKGSIHFIKALEIYINCYEEKAIVEKYISYHDKLLYSKEDLSAFLSTFYQFPLQEKIDMLNKRLSGKIKMINEQEELEKEAIQVEIKKYKNYFGNKIQKIDFFFLYLDFINSLLFERDIWREKKIELPQEHVIRLLLQNLNNGFIDLYDFGMLTYFKRRFKITDDFNFVSHIVIDEAQDFGVSIFYILKKLFKNCTFTIMGDVSQNIYYDTGMNDWDTLIKEVFSEERAKFYVLAKSYRNTVEISDFASAVLKKCSFKTYEIEPIIRHGKQIEILDFNSTSEMFHQSAALLKGWREEGYDTIAVICRTVEEAEEVTEGLSNLVELTQQADIETLTFTSGIMVLPIHMTKGLEFDTVLLWNPTEENYPADDADAKLLYVAITRALHELTVVFKGELSGLFEVPK